MEAACSGDVEVCQLLLEARAAATQSETITALGFAESEGHREAEELNDLQLLSSIGGGATAAAHGRQGFIAPN